MEFDVARLRLGDVEYRVMNFIEANAKKWAEEEVLQKCQQKMWARGYTEEVIGSTWVETKREGLKILVDVFWDYRGDNEEPIAWFLEFGTKAHPIRAKGKSFGGADYLAWMGKNGKRIYRKEVKHPGFVGAFIMKSTEDEGEQALTKRAEKEIQTFLDSTRIV